MGIEYITTPIYYVNDVPHIGHAYTTVAADVLSRYHRLRGCDTFFLTGTDEHGRKVEQAAVSAGVRPIELADGVVERFRQLWDALDIRYDDFIRTTEKRHGIAVAELVGRVYEAGDIYLGQYEDWYCVPCETFLTESQLVDGKCPDCGRPTEKLKEASYFFNLPKYEQPLLEYIDEHPDCIMPESRRNEVVSFIEGGLKPLSISRTAFKWGIPMPMDPAHVVYVWMDALTNYLTGIGWPQEEGRFNQYWPHVTHLIGKDILRFHAVYWPAFLMAAGMEPPLRIFAHGWWTNEGEKMSKSRGNFVDPVPLIKRYGSDALRFFFFREVTFGLDGDFSEKALVKRINNELADNFGNLLQRVLKMIGRYRQGRIPEPTGNALEAMAIYKKSVLERIHNAMTDLALHKALYHTGVVISETNGLVESSAPWNLAKEPAAGGKLDDVLYELAERLRFIAVLMAPFTPAACSRAWAQLGIKETMEERDIGKPIEHGTVIGKPEILFKKFD